MGKAIVEAGPWLIEGGKPTERVHFFKRGIAWTPWGGGSWRATGALTVELKLCSTLSLTFDSATEPTRFTYSGGKRSAGRLDPQYAALPGAEELLLTMGGEKYTLSVRGVIGCYQARLSYCPRPFIALAPNPNRSPQPLIPNPSPSPSPSPKPVQRGAGA